MHMISALVAVLAAIELEVTDSKCGSVVAAAAEASRGQLWGKLPVLHYPFPCCDSLVGS